METKISCVLKVFSPVKVGRFMFAVSLLFAVLIVSRPSALAQTCVGSDGQPYRYSTSGNTEILGYDTHYSFPHEANAIATDTTAVWVEDPSYSTGGYIRILHNANCGLMTTSDGNTCATNSPKQPVDYDSEHYSGIYAIRSSSTSIWDFSTEYPVTGGSTPGNRNVVRDVNSTAMYGMTHPRLLNSKFLVIREAFKLPPPVPHSGRGRSVTSEWWLFYVAGGDIYAAEASSSTASDFVDDTADCGTVTGASCNPTSDASPVLTASQMATDTGNSNYSSVGLSSSVGYRRVGLLPLSLTDYFRIFVSGTDGNLTTPLAIYSYTAPASNLRSWTFEGGPRVGDDTSTDATQWAVRPAGKLIDRSGGCVTLFYQGWDGTTLQPVIKYATSPDKGLSFGTPQELTDSSGTVITGVSGPELVQVENTWYILYDWTPNTLNDADGLGVDEMDGGVSSMAEIVFEN